MQDQGKFLWSENGFSTVILISAGYALAVALGCWTMERFPTFSPNTKLFSSIHNTFLCVLSVYIFVGAAPQFYHNWKGTDFNVTLFYCDEAEVLKEGMENWHYVFFLTKFLEFLDTAFLILNRKYSYSLGWYLQVYHHSTTAAIAWVAWWRNVPAWWYGLLSNAFVHIIMYLYFSMVVLDRRLRSVGHLVTHIQLVQFYVAMGSAFVVNGIQDLWGYDCNDSFHGRMFVSFMYLSYLLFFLAFHKERSAAMKKRQQEKSKRL
eukprot:m.136400 g.136400  ORF g.136400 m.136400 type:complete len:262 (+) comp14732_c0_seq2:76-861(+)